MLRTFVAIDLPDAAREHLALMQGGIPGARWVSDDNLHITLRFVGDIEGHVFDQLADALERIQFPPFDVQLSGVGHFPPRKQPKSLWVGVQSDALKALRDRVERTVVEVGLDAEQRKYHPHVTVTRLNGSPSSKVARFLGSYGLFRVEPFLVSSFHLYTSYLHQQGAEYSREVSFDLRD